MIFRITIPVGFVIRRDAKRLAVLVTEPGTRPAAPAVDPPPPHRSEPGCQSDDDDGQQQA